ncbi:uncharacterized protein METZ01_LOCUS441692, partial [marine metagenome]
AQFYVPTVKEEYIHLQIETNLLSPIPKEYL